MLSAPGRDLVLAAARCNRRAYPPSLSGCKKPQNCALLLKGTLL